MTDDIHSCSYYCDRPGCIKAQRDELVRKYVETQEKTHPVAWLHNVTLGDGETDQALSFSSESFPLSTEFGFRSLGAVPLYAYPIGATYVQDSLIEFIPQAADALADIGRKELSLLLMIIHKSMLSATSEEDHDHS